MTNDQTITARRQQLGLGADQMTAEQEAKVAEVLEEFETGTLRSSSGEVVTSRRQALAIALTQAGARENE